MKLLAPTLVGALLPVVTPFAPSSIISKSLRDTNVEPGHSTKISMAFKTDEPSNIFDGPMALTKERDACGVGFIANTKSGGR